MLAIFQLFLHQQVAPIAALLRPQSSRIKRGLSNHVSHLCPGGGAVDATRCCPPSYVWIIIH